MANRTYEEVLRFLVQAEGAPELARLSREILSLGEAGQESEQRLAGLLDELSSAQGLERTAAEFRRLGSEVVDLNGRYNAARENMRRVAEAMAEVAEPTRRQQQEFNRARRELESLGEALSSTRAEWSQQRAVLNSAGVSTRNYAEAQADVLVRQQEAAGALREYANETLNARQAAQRAADAQQQQAASLQRLRDRLGGAGAEARQYGAAARGAAHDTGALGDAAERTQGRFGGLKSALSGIGAYLGIREAAEGVKSLFGLASEAESLKKSLGNLYGSAERGNEVYKELEAFSKRNGIAFSDAAKAAQKLKAAGMDPLNGSLQALVDQNAAVGGSQEDLEGKGRALSQMWAKQRIQMEEVLQLNERGVPVFEILAKVTGKQGLELAKFIESGRAGRDVIKAFYEEIGNQNAGAAAGNLETLSGKLIEVKAKWNEFWRAVADNGVTDYFKTQLQVLLDSTGGMDALAKRVSDGIIGTLSALKRFGEQLAPVGKMIADVTLGLAKHAEVMMLVGKVYAATKIAKFASEFLAVAARATAASTALEGAAAAAETGATGLSRFGKMAGAIPRLLKFSLITIGIDLAISGAMKLAEVIKEAQEAQSRLNLGEAGLRTARAEQLRIGQQLQQVYGQYAQVAIQSAQQIGQLSQDQASAYQHQLDQAQRYWRGVALEAHASGNAQREALALSMYEQAGKAIDSVAQRLSALAEAAKGTKLDQMVDGFVEKFDQLRNSGKTAAEAISGAFNGIEFKDVDGLKAVDDLIIQISARGKEAGDAVRTELRDQLNKLSAEDLARVRDSMESAFGVGTEKAKLFGAELDKVNAAKLGVDLDAVMTGFTSKGKDAIAAVQNIRASLTQMGATAEQKSQAMAQAFDNAFKQITTQGELKGLKKQLEESFRRGEISVDEFQERVKLADAALKEMTASGAKVGMTVADAANRASQALANIGRQQQQNAQQTTQDLKKQGGAVHALIKGVKSASDNEREAVERAKQGAEAMGEAIQGVGQTAAGMQEQLKAAADAYSNLGLTTRKVSPEIAEHLKQVKLAVVGSTSGGVDRVYIDAVNAVTREVEAQGKRADAEYDRTMAKLKKLEPVNKELERLSKQYNLLDTSELQKLADAQKQLREARAAQRNAANAGTGATESITPAKANESKIIVEIQATAAAGAVGLAGVQAAKVGQEIAQVVLAQVARSRQVSTRPRLGR